ncbi:MAG TPA: hypothetical protein ENN22_15600 [bacterium]|nr:hypothetical protein [bacterium]
MVVFSLHLKWEKWMRVRAAIMTLLNITAMADGKVRAEEKELIFESLKRQFQCTDEELEKSFQQNLGQLEADPTEMIKQAVLVLREECSVVEIKKVIKLLKDLSMIDKKLDRREMMIIEMLEQLTATAS